MIRRLLRTFRLVLAAAIIVGLVSPYNGSGTYASFQAQATNPNNTFQTGTLSPAYE